jgi:hypothetical protein
VVPPHNAMHPDVVAKVVVDCIEGQRPDDQGKCIFLPSP